MFRARCRLVVPSARVSAAALLVSLAGTASAQPTVWQSAGGGDWNDAGNWSLGVPDTPDEAAEISLAGMYTITITGSPTAGDVSILNADATVEIFSGRQLSMVSNTEPEITLTNDGVITLNSNQNVFSTALVIGDPDTGGVVTPGPTSTGEIVLNLGSGNNDFNDATMTLTGPGARQEDGHTIRGKGRIAGAFTNNGLIVADRIGDELRVSAGVVQGVTGVLRATADGRLGIGEGGSVSGGLIETDTGGTAIVQSGSATLLGGVRLDGNLGTTSAGVLRFGPGGIVNDGTITINVNQSVSTSQAIVEADITLAGTGRVDFNISDANNDFNDAFLTTDAGVTATNGTAHSITGKGRLNGVWINDGLIQADRDGQELRIEADVTQPPAGVIGATNGGVLGIANGAIVRGGRVVTSSGGSVQVTSGTGTVEGGLINEGEMGVRNNQTMAIGTGGIVNDGTITVNSNQGTLFTSLRVDAPVSILGNGVIDLNVGDGNTDFNDARLETGGMIIATIGPSQRITGKGRVLGEFIHFGTIDADRAAQDLRVENSVIDQTGGGVIMGSNGGFAVITNSTILGGTLDSTTGGAVVGAGNASRLDGVRSLGDAGVRNNSVMFVDAGGITNDGTFTINTQQGTLNTRLEFATDATLDGSGRVVLNIGDANADFNDARLRAAPGFTCTIGAGQTVSGKGKLDGSFINNGVVSGDRPGQDLRIEGAVTQGAGGVIRGDNGGIAVLNGAEVSGGTFDSANGGRVDYSGAGNTLESVTSHGDAGVRNNSSVVLLAGGFTNNGTFTINTQQSTLNTLLTAGADAEIDGTGTIILNINEGNGDFNDAWLGAEDGSVLTIGPGQTVTGRGNLRGEIVMNGTLAPGMSIGTMQLIERGASGLLTFGPSAVYHAEASETMTGDTINDRLSAFEPIQLAGTLRFEPIDGFVPPRPSGYTVMTGPDIQGTFDAIEYVGTLPPDTVFRVFYAPDEVAVAITCAGDFAFPIGQVTFGDVASFISAFNDEDPRADLAVPFGQFTFGDVGAFLAAFTAGCP